MRGASLRECIDALSGGDIVALPTETVYGLACLALEEQSVDKVFQLKKRPSDNPLIVHVLDLDQAQMVAVLNPIAKLLCNEFWPGPLTLILPKRDELPGNVTACLETVAVRSPSHALFRTVLKEVGQPLAAPSANPHSKLSPTNAEEVLEFFDSELPVLDGGKCTFGVESTVLDLTSEKPSILRPGPIAQDTLEEFLGIEILSGLPRTKKGEPQKSPGLALKHYAPETSVRLYSCFDEILELEDLTSDDLIIVPHHGMIALVQSSSPAKVLSFSKTGEPEDIARNLYATLRAADCFEKKLIHVALLRDTTGIIAAINDRLRRASTFS